MAGAQEGTQPGAALGWAQGFPRAAGGTEGQRGWDILGHCWAPACWGMCCVPSWVFFPVLKLCSTHKFSCFCSFSSPSQQWAKGWAAGWGDPAQWGSGAVLNTPEKMLFPRGKPANTSQYNLAINWEQINSIAGERAEFIPLQLRRKALLRGCSASPEFPEDGRQAQNSPCSYTHSSERFKSPASAKTTHSTLPQGPESMS